MAKRTAMIIYTDCLEKFQRLTDEQFGKLMRYGMEYQMTGETPDIDDPFLAFAFDSIKVNIDADTVKYEAKVEARRAAGSKGGKARASKVKQSQAKVANAKFAKQNKQTVANQANTITNTNTNTNTITNTNTNINNITAFENQSSSKAKEKHTKENPRYFPNDELLERTFQDFIAMRNKIRKPMTDRAIKDMLLRLERLSIDPGEQVKIFEQSIMNCWTNIYPLKDDTGRRNSDSIADRWANIH